MSDDPHDEEDVSVSVHKHIQALVGAHMPDDGDEALTRKRLVAKFAHMYFVSRLPELAERTQAAEDLLAEVAFWWSMHQVAANVHTGKPLPELPDGEKKHS